MGQRAKEAAEIAEVGFIFQATNESIGMGQVQNEGGDISSPEGLERIARASGGAVVLEAGQQGRVDQAGEHGGKFAQGILRGCAIMR